MNNKDLLSKEELDRLLEGVPQLEVENIKDSNYRSFIYQQQESNQELYSQDEIDILLLEVSLGDIEIKQNKAHSYNGVHKRVCNLDALTQSEVDRIIHGGT